MSCGCGLLLGNVARCAEIVLTRGGDYYWNWKLVYPDGSPQPLPPGQLYYEIDTEPVVTRYQFHIEGEWAMLKIESEAADKIPDHTPFRLVWLADGELAGGEIWAKGKVQVGQ